MRFEKGHKEKTRERIVATAAKRFRKDGVAATGLAGLMAEAGLTHGGFYAHFSSKEELVRAAMNAALEQTQASRAEVLAKTAPGPLSLDALVRYYLRPAHRDSPERGCCASALVAEIARHEPETREIFQANLQKLLGQIAGTLAEDLGAEERERRAIGIFGCLLGTLQVARAVVDPALSEKILEGGIAAALALGEAAR